MLRIENLTEEDVKEIKAIPKSFLVTVYFLLLICFPASFLLGLLGLTKKGYGYWPTTIAFLVVFIFAGLFVTIKDFLLYQKDKAKQKKYVGTITVMNKSAKRGDYKIYTDAPELKELNLYSNELFDAIATGDTLTIEISTHSKTIFRLEKDHINLLNRN
ncbi:hypothetical protein [Phnomibacter sp. MR]|uniref:hypothetical protein n=1 Tax=Phnomibacter sp. MR TaxID=3042318 RepID=UPI003A810A1D